MDVRQIAEACPAVRGEHDVVGGACGRGDDQIVGTTRGSGALNVGEHCGVFVGDLMGVVEYRSEIQRLLQERALPFGPIRVGGQEYPVEGGTTAVRGSAGLLAGRLATR